MSFFTNNRQLIKGLAINTGTTANPVWKDLCCASELESQQTWNNKTSMYSVT